MLRELIFTFSDGKPHAAANIGVRRTLYDDKQQPVAQSETHMGQADVSGNVVKVTDPRLALTDAEATMVAAMAAVAKNACGGVYVAPVTGVAVLDAE